MSEPTPEERANRLPYWSPRKTLEELVAAEIRAAVEAERERCVRVAQRAAGAWFYDIPDDYEEILDGAMREDS